MYRAQLAWSLACVFVPQQRGVGLRWGLLAGVLQPFLLGGAACSQGAACWHVGAHCNSGEVAETFLEK